MTDVLATRIDMALALIAAVPSRREAIAERWRAATGGDWPDTPRFGAGVPAVAALGPGRWLAVDPSGDGAALERRLAVILGDAALVTDQSDAREVTRLAGPGVRALLEKGCALDLHPRSAPPGTLAASTIAGMTAWIWSDSATVFLVATQRSTSRSFGHWLDASLASLRIAARGE